MKSSSKRCFMFVPAAMLALVGIDQALADNVTVINTSANPVPVTVQQRLVYDGKFFNVTKPAGQDPTLTVPSGVVMTDAHVTFSTPENVANAASLYIADGSKTLVYQIVNTTTFQAGISLGSGIKSNGNLKVKLSCYNIAGNHCQGAIMWSGYRP